MIKSIGRGISIGIFTHLIIDTFLWFNHIHILWPLPIKPVNLWSFVDIPIMIYKLLYILEFFFFRVYAWFLIKRHILLPNQNSWLLKYLNIWKNLETYIIIILLLLLSIELSLFKILIALAYIPSLVMALFSTYISRDALELDTCK